MIYRASKITGSRLEAFESLGEAKLLVSFNDENTKILLRGGVIANDAAGKNEIAAVANIGGVSVNGSGEFVFDGYSHLRFNDTGFDFSSGKSWTLDFSFADVGAGRNDFCSPSDAYAAPCLYRSDRILNLYGPTQELAVTVEDYAACLYSVQYDAPNTATTVWLNGVRVGTSRAVSVWHYGFSDSVLPYQIGLAVGSNACAHRLKYFRASNCCRYNASNNFEPNLTGF